MTKNDPTRCPFFPLAMLSLIAFIAITVAPLKAVAEATEALSASASPIESEDLPGESRDTSGSAAEAGVSLDSADPVSDAGFPPEPLSLENLIELALRNNLEIHAQGNALEAAKQKAREQFTLGKPRVGAKQIYSLQERVPGFGSTSLGDKETSIYQVSLTQPVYTFGRLENGVRMVNAEHLAEQSQSSAVRTDIIHRVIRNFLDVMKERNRIRIANETLGVLQEHLKLVETLLEAGVILNTDVSMTKVKLLEARQGLIESRNSLDVARLSLFQLAGLPDASDPDFPDIPPMPLNASTTLDNPDQQPEVKKLDHLIKAGENGYKIAKKGNLPMVGLQWTWSSGNQFLEDFKSWNANVVLDFPFFDSGLSQAQRRQAGARLDQLKNLREDARNKFDLALKKSARKVQEMQEKFALARQIEETARENFTNLQTQYKEGGAINTDVLTAQLALSNARIGVNNAYYDYVAYLADHYRSQGRIDDFVALVQQARDADSTSKQVTP